MRHLECLLDFTFIYNIIYFCFLIQGLPGLDGEDGLPGPRGPQGESVSIYREW